jgi:hypothetical protein
MTVPLPSPRFATGERVGALGHGVGVVRALRWRGGAWEYLVLLDGEARQRVCVAESIVRPAHPADCPHPRCQLPF